MTSYVLFGLAIGGIDVSANTRAAAVEHHYGHSIFASFYAVWSGAGVAAALVTAGTTRLGWAIGYTLTLQAALVLALAMGIRSHDLPEVGTGPEMRTPRRHRWAESSGPDWSPSAVLLFAYVVDSSVSTWSTAYLHQTLAASLAAAPLAYAAYQAGTVVGRTGADRLVRRIGQVAVVCCAAVLTATALTGLACAPTWPIATIAAGFTGLGVSALAPLCLASAGRVQPDAAEAVLARLNLFNYAVSSQAARSAESSDQPAICSHPTSILVSDHPASAAKVTSKTTALDFIPLVHRLQVSASGA